MKPTNDSGGKQKFFDPVRGEPPEDCDILGWSCCYENDDRNSFAVSEDKERNAMEMAAGGPDRQETYS